MGKTTTVCDMGLHDKCGGSNCDCACHEDKAQIHGPLDMEDLPTQQSSADLFFDEKGKPIIRCPLEAVETCRAADCQACLFRRESNGGVGSFIFRTKLGVWRAWPYSDTSGVGCSKASGEVCPQCGRSD